ncbi:hypothetical protein GUJ93_ZPchr0002g24675 [Zizania palustris]|uniref:Uncharacterized protein n=1 Tax=Zizania palustris TaxID=103762 RepID=A0A8J5V544_ZIZPA|nr:hypothetical protein GUJ93_ZPchr0002g24675 [Zizania palustris]
MPESILSIIVITCVPSGSVSERHLRVNSSCFLPVKPYISWFKSESISRGREVGKVHRYRRRPEVPSGKIHDSSLCTLGSQRGQRIYFLAEFLSRPICGGQSLTWFTRVRAELQAKSEFGL